MVYPRMTFFLFVFTCFTVVALFLPSPSSEKKERFFHRRVFVLPLPRLRSSIRFVILVFFFPTSASFDVSRE